MENPEGSSNAQPAIGNVAVPDWMLKRRARQAQAAARNAGSAGPAMAAEDADSTSDSLALEAAVSESEVDTVKDLVPLGKEAPAWFRASSARTAIVPTVVEASAAPVEPQAKSVANPLAKSAEPRAESVTISEALPEIDLGEKIIPPWTSGAEQHTSDAKIVDLGLVLPPIESEVPVPLEWYEELRERWWRKETLRSLGISIFTHVLICLPLSLVVFHAEVINLGVNTLFSAPSDEALTEPLDETTVFEVDASGGQTSDNLNTMLAANAVSNALGPTALSVPENISGFSKGEGNGKGDEIGDGIDVGGYKMPEGGKAVNKGSFTAWTVPEDPQPGEDYKIVIQVKYKKRNLKIPKGDITGSVIGTDKFRLMISPSTSEVIAEANQVVIYVPGAAARVRDTIRVYSATLKENQRLEIVF